MEKEKVKKNHARYWLGKKQTKDTIEKRVSKIRGENNWQWKGGISPENVKIRNSPKYKLWQRSCMERDCFIDKKTGQKGGKLEVHHIHNFADYPELRFVVENGVTLSKKSHREFHFLYGNKNNTQGQLNEFLTI